MSLTTQPAQDFASAVSAREDIISVCETVDPFIFEPDQMTLAKAMVRQRHLRSRDDVDAATRDLLASRLAEIGPRVVRGFVGPHAAAVVSLFSTIGSEPDALPLAVALDAEEVRLSLPVDYSSGAELVYRSWTPGDPLTPGPLGIAEPLHRAAEVEPDILFIPMIAFDRLGRRVGYGAGNVDSTLRALRARRSVLVIGVAFACQEEPAVPFTSRDEPVDMIVTDRESIDCRG